MVCVQYYGTLNSAWQGHFIFVIFAIGCVPFSAVQWPSLGKFVLGLTKILFMLSLSSLSVGSTMMLFSVVLCVRASSSSAWGWGANTATYCTDVSLLLCCWEWWVALLVSAHTLCIHHINILLFKCCQPLIANYRKLLAIHLPPWPIPQVWWKGYRICLTKTWRSSWNASEPHQTSAAG